MRLGRMNPNRINSAFVVFRKEVTENLRDRRTIINALIMGPLLGQLLFGALCDGLGWLGLARRRPSGKDALAALLVMAGALLIVLG